MKIKKLLKLFFAWCEEHREHSTVRHYQSRLSSFKERFGKMKICDLKPLDLPKDLVLYLTRHEHASQICEKLGIHAAAEALGHASLQTTKRYVKTNPEALRRNQDAFED